MKKITIPKCRNPFVVILNGIRYEYESGQVIEVPKAVAEIIENHVDSKPKAEPVVGGGSGGICNRPHVYISDSFDKLPTDAVDGSLAVVKATGMLGKWTFNETLTFDGIDSSKDHIFYFEFKHQFPQNEVFYTEVAIMNGNTNVIFASDQWYDEPYHTDSGWWWGSPEYWYRDIYILTEPTDEVFINWLKENASQHETIYSRVNGKWVYEEEVDFTDLISD